MCVCVSLTLNALPPKKTGAGTHTASQSVCQMAAQRKMVAGGFRLRSVI